MGIPAAIIGATALFAGTQVVSGIFQASAAKKASRQAAQAAERARQDAERQRQQVRQDSLAQIEAGQAATRSLARTGFVPAAGEDADFSAAGLSGPALSTDIDENDPFFQQRLEFGTRNINRNLAALGQRFSGLQAQLVTDFETRLFGEETNKRRQELQFLSSLGTDAAANTGRTSASLTGIGANATIAGGNALAQGTIGSTEAITSGVTGGAGTIAGGLGDLVQFKQNNALIKVRGGEPVETLF